MMKKSKKENSAEEREVVEKEMMPQEDKDNGITEDNQESVNDEVSKLNDKYLRLAAEFDNYRRRTLKEKQDLILYAGEETIKGLLPIIDDFERALSVLKNSDEKDSPVLEGTELIYNKLKSFLTSKGVKEIDSVGEVLDTDLHEAVAQAPTSDESQKERIIDVVQKGYTLNGKVIRFAKVVMGQ